MIFSILSTAFFFLTSSVLTTTVPRVTNLSNLAAKIPQNGLPKPDGLELKYVLLGIGTQNYTCTTGNSTSPPGTTGAVGMYPQPQYYFIRYLLTLSKLNSTTSEPASTQTQCLNGRSTPSPLLPCTFLPTKTGWINISNSKATTSCSVTTSSPKPTLQLIILPFLSTKLRRPLTRSPLSRRKTRLMRRRLLSLAIRRRAL
jgi:hypothetical protein